MCEVLELLPWQVSDRRRERRLQMHVLAVFPQNEWGWRGHISPILSSQLPGDERWPLRRKSFQMVTDNQTLAEQINGRATVDDKS